MSIELITKKNNLELTTASGGEEVQKAYEQGKEAERQEWWNNFNYGGTRTNYEYAFCYWSREAFNPPTDIVPSSLQRAFMFLQKFDLKERLDELGVKLDTSKCRSLAHLFGSASVTGAPIISCLYTTTLEAVFNNCGNLKYIEKIILKADGSNKFSTNCFYCVALEEVRFEGVIGNDISFQYCPLLSKESLLSILAALKDFSGTTTTKTLTLHADSKAKLSEEEKQIATKKGWTIA